jgi:DtxR family transcriptional regulator, Mn-dependent transcriptional regulator
VSDLVDATEMYLRIIYELEEEGVRPMRVRIAERLGQSGPTVSGTIGRMERDGLVVVSGDRHLELTGPGRERATAVMRKHRLAERLLTDVIGLEWDLVHAEACRLEHVMSDAVERKLVGLLGGPRESPYGNPIPGLDALSTGVPSEELPLLPAAAGLVRLDELARSGGGDARVRRIAEYAQERSGMLRALGGAGLLPGADVRVGRTRAATDPVPVETPGTSAALPVALAHAVLVAPAGGAAEPA